MNGVGGLHASLTPPSPSAVMNGVDAFSASFPDSTPRAPSTASWAPSVFGSAPVLATDGSSANAQNPLLPWFDMAPDSPARRKALPPLPDEARLASGSSIHTLTDPAVLAPVPRLRLVPSSLSSFPSTPSSSRPRVRPLGKEKGSQLRCSACGTPQEGNHDAWMTRPRDHGAEKEKAPSP
jgi:hypothetical protein